MSIRQAILEHIARIARETNGPAVPLADETRLLDTGLDSLGLAILAARLEDELGVDLFSAETAASYPTTLGGLIGMYERASRGTAQAAMP